jgi:hypothetical protein
MAARGVTRAEVLQAAIGYAGALMHLARVEERFFGPESGELPPLEADLEQAKLIEKAACDGLFKVIGELP